MIPRGAIDRSGIADILTGLLEGAAPHHPRFGGAGSKQCTDDNRQQPCPYHD